MKVKCSGCLATLNAPEKLYGKQVKCPKCQLPIQIPDADESPQKIPVQCTVCAAKISVAKKLIGKSANCPKCKSTIQLVPIEQNLPGAKKKSVPPNVGVHNAPATPQSNPKQSPTSRRPNPASTGRQSKSRMPLIVAGSAIGILLIIGGVTAVIMMGNGGKKGGNKSGQSAAGIEPLSKKTAENGDAPQFGKPYYPMALDSRSNIPQPAFPLTNHETVQAGNQVGYEFELIMSIRPPGGTGGPGFGGPPPGMGGPGGMPPIKGSMFFDFEQVSTTSAKRNVNGKELTIQFPAKAAGTAVGLPGEKVIVAYDTIRNAKTITVDDGSGPKAATVELENPEVGFAILNVPGLKDFTKPKTTCYSQLDEHSNGLTVMWINGSQVDYVQNVDISQGQGGRYVDLPGSYSQVTLGGVALTPWGQIGGFVLRNNHRSAKVIPINRIQKNIPTQSGVEFDSQTQMIGTTMAEYRMEAAANLCKVNATRQPKADDQTVNVYCSTGPRGPFSFRATLGSDGKLNVDSKYQDAMPLPFFMGGLYAKAFCEIPADKNEWTEVVKFSARSNGKPVSDSEWERIDKVDRGLIEIVSKKEPGSSPEYWNISRDIKIEISDESEARKRNYPPGLAITVKGQETTVYNTKTEMVESVKFVGSATNGSGSFEYRLSRQEDPSWLAKNSPKSNNRTIYPTRDLSDAEFKELATKIRTGKKADAFSAFKKLLGSKDRTEGPSQGVSEVSQSLVASFEKYNDDRYYRYASAAFVLPEDVPQLLEKWTPNQDDTLTILYILMSQPRVKDEQSYQTVQRICEWAIDDGKLDSPAIHLIHFRYPMMAVDVLAPRVNQDYTYRGLFRIARSLAEVGPAEVRSVIQGYRDLIADKGKEIIRSPQVWMNEFDQWLEQMDARQ